MDDSETQEDGEEEKEQAMTSTQLWVREMERYCADLAVKRVKHSREWNTSITIGLGSPELQRIARRVNRIARARRGNAISMHAHAKR